MDAAMNRAFMALSALLLSITGVTVGAIPSPPPDDVRIVRVLDGNTIVVTPYADPFSVRLACIHSPQLHQGAAGLPPKGSVSQSRAMRGGYQRGYNVSTSARCGLGSGEAGQNWQLARDPPRKAAA